MFRAIAKLLSLTTLVTIGVLGILMYRHSTAIDRRTAELMSENEQLTQIVTRLTDENRVAEMLVQDQQIVNGIPRTTLMFQEYSRNHSMLPMKTFSIAGNQVHLDAMVIKFDRGFVKENDPLRGHSIALFTKIYGNHQSPDEGLPIDAPGQIPGYYQGINPRVSDFESGLWKDFWQLTKDASLRQKSGVRISNGEGLWWNCELDQLYTITIEADGGLNVTTEPVKGIYREAMHRKTGGT